MLITNGTPRCSATCAIAAAAPAVVAYLDEQRYAGAGALGVLPRVGKHQPSGNVGQVNRRMAARLGTALALLPQDADGARLLQDDSDAAPNAGVAHQRKKDRP